MVLHRYNLAFQLFILHLDLGTESTLVVCKRNGCNNIHVYSYVIDGIVTQMQTLSKGHCVYYVLGPRYIWGKMPDMPGTPKQLVIFWVLISMSMSMLWVGQFRFSCGCGWRRYVCWTLEGRGRYANYSWTLLLNICNVKIIMWWWGFGAYCDGGGEGIRRHKKHAIVGKGSLWYCRFVPSNMCNYV